MLCINYNVYIICYVDTMLSTYYIYYIVTTYYVVNGITIIKYLHNGNCHKCGYDNYMSPLCPLEKWAFVCVYTTLCGVPCELYAIGKGNGYGES